MSNTVDNEIKRTCVHVTKKQFAFLERIVHEDGATSVGGTGEKGNAVQWCIDACMKIEELYGIDALYVGYNDIRKPKNQP